jgi:hypothetical protein
MFSCAWLAIALGVLPALAGCSTTSPTHSGDPLFGEYYPKGPNGQPMPPPNPAPHKTTSTGVPPYPTVNSAGSTAAIANNTGLPGGRNLAINENSGTNWALTNTSNTGTPAGVAPATATPIVRPIPRDTTGPVAVSIPVQPGNPAANSNPVTSANLGTTSAPAGTIIPTGALSASAEAPQKKTAPVAPTGVVTPDDLQRTLQGKGALGLKKDEIAEGVRVSCYVPQQSNPANLRYLETVAPDYPTGLQALLQQIDR